MKYFLRCEVTEFDKVRVSVVLPLTKLFEIDIRIGTQFSLSIEYICRPDRLKRALGVPAIYPVRSTVLDCCPGLFRIAVTCLPQHLFSLFFLYSQLEIIRLDIIRRVIYFSSSEKHVSLPDSLE